MITMRMARNMQANFRATDVLALSLIRELLLAIALSLTLTDSSLYAQPSVQSGRPLGINDLFNLYQFGQHCGGSPFAFSPDGRQLAFVIQRPKKTAQSHSPFLFGNDRADIYISSLSGGRAVNITNGLADGSGYWAPTWSPDGKRLAALSTKGGNVYVWVWEQASGTLRQVTGRGVDIFFASDQPFYWISATHLLVPVLPPGAKPDGLLGNKRAAIQTNNAWPKAWAGREAVVSVLISGVKPDLNQRPRGELLVVDVVTGGTRAITQDKVRNIVLSPDQKAVAYLRQVGVYQPEPDKQLEFNVVLAAGKFELDIVSTDGVSLLPDQRDPATYNVIPTSLRWSPDGEELAFLANTRAIQNVPALISFRRSSRTFKVLRIDELDPSPSVRQFPQLEWTPRGWIIFASRRNQSIKSSVHARRDWWLVSENAPPHSITDGMRQVPSYLARGAGIGSYVGLANGDLWQISAETPPQNLTESFDKAIHTLYGASPVNATNRNLVVGSHLAGKEELFTIDLVSRQVTSVLAPTPQAAIAAVSAANMSTLFSLNDRTGLRLWIAADPHIQASVIFEANTFLQEIAPAIQRKVEYRSSSGQNLSAWLLLPPDYQSDKKYPLIVWVYAGWVAGPSPSWADDISFARSLNLQIPVARGYVVLKPSIPLGAEGEPDDPLLKLTAGALPAVNKVIELGVADPDRIFVMGSSFGGYATYGLITQTHQFKAAVAMAGLCNLISGYLQLNTSDRYDDYPHENPAKQDATIETALRLGGSPPWKDFGRYLRNSPIFYVDRVQTPLMIIHGDMDGVPIEQAEEFFMALYRQGKRAEFRRYWGEGHSIESPANVRDMWDSILAWFEEFSHHSKGFPLGNSQK
jgi:dipeptidyl aminopeptidase/acylaminoacyl peptidase